MEKSMIAIEKKKTSKRGKVEKKNNGVAEEVATHLTPVSSVFKFSPFSFNTRHTNEINACTATQTYAQSGKEREK